jgi:hypothetical protein
MLIGQNLGGTDPQPAYRTNNPMATNRKLAPYVLARETFHCPADRGFFLPTSKVWQFQPSTYETAGCSYTLNWLSGYSTAHVAADPYYNLAGKKQSWAPEPSRFIMIHERVTFPWAYGSPDGGVAQWHYSAYPGRMFTPANLKNDRDRLVGPILFVDGHCKVCDFTKTFANPLFPNEPGEDFIRYKPATSQ